MGEDGVRVTTAHTTAWMQRDAASRFGVQEVEQRSGPTYRSCCREPECTLVHEDRPGWRTSTELMYRRYGMPMLQEQTSVTPQSQKKRIFRGSLLFSFQLYAIKRPHLDVEYSCPYHQLIH
jgi:hypothetical protein